MQVKREELLARLRLASLGLSDKPILEQSTAFVFLDERIVAFNDEVMTEVAGLSGLTGVVDAASLIKILDRFPDEELDLEFTPTELQARARNRELGLPAEKEVRLPYASVPEAGKFTKLGEGVRLHLLQAARTCGKDETRVMSTCVHVTPKTISGCDNYRLYQAQIATGFPEEGLVPAGVLERLVDFNVRSVSLAGGWAHFKIHQKSFGEGNETALVHVRCVSGAYPSVAGILEVEGEEVLLPKNLAEVLARAEVFSEVGHAARVQISLEKQEMRIESRREGAGWYRERRKVEYAGRPLKFEVHPQFLVQALEHTRSVVVGENRMKLKIEDGETKSVAHVVFGLFVAPPPLEPSKKKGKAAVADAEADDEENPF